MVYKKFILVIFVLFLMGCASKKGVVIPPNGGASISVNEALWVSGIRESNLKYSESFPNAQENKFFKVVNAGYWLANTNGKVSQLIYSFDIDNKKVLPQSKLYTRAAFTNPKDKNNPFVYTGTIDNTVGSSKITHAMLSNVKLNEEYFMSFDVYTDSDRTQLLTRINQKIVSAVDNTSGCVKLSKDYMNEKFGTILDPKGKLIPVDKLIIHCVRD